VVHRRRTEVKLRFPPWRFSPRAFLFTLTLSVLFALPASANPQEKQWSVESVPGTEFGEKKLKIDLRISHQVVVARHKKLASTEIPVEAIVSVNYDETGHSKGRGMWNASTDPVLNDKDLDFIGMPLVFGAALAAPFKTREHYIHILWQKDAESQEISFQAGKGDYKNILAELQTVTGKPWHDLPSERQKLREELDKAKEHKVGLEVDRPALVNGAELKPGPYQLVLLEREESQGEAYFFAGSQVHLDHVAAQALVQVEHSVVTPDDGPKPSGTVQPEMVFGNPANKNTLTDLHLPDKTLHFTSPAVPGIAGSTARLFSLGGNRLAVVRNTTYNGEPALSFRVLHSAFRPCAEILYVTRTKVAVEPASLSEAQCTALSAPREEVKAQAPTGTWATSSLEFKWNEKPYRFQPLFESGNGDERIAGIGRESRAAAHEFGEFFVRAVEDFDAVEREVQPAAAPKTEP
jgi:hypothetical protein